MTRNPYADADDFWQPPSESARKWFADQREAAKAPPAPPPVSADPNNWGWQALASWGLRDDARGRFTSWLHRCDEHPRLERIGRSYMDARTITTWYVNGEPLATLEFAVKALEDAERFGRYPSAGQTYLTLKPPPPVVAGAAPADDLDAELRSLEEMARGFTSPSAR